MLRWQSNAAIGFSPFSGPHTLEGPDSAVALSLARHTGSEAYGFKSPLTLR